MFSLCSSNKPCVVWLGKTGQTEGSSGVVWCGSVYTTDWTEQRMGWEWGPGNHWGDLAQLQLETIKWISNIIIIIFYYTLVPIKH